MDHIVYSTTTGSAPVDHRLEGDALSIDNDRYHGPQSLESRGIEPEPFCFVCGRATDHFAEHDDLVEAGLATYDGVYVLNGEPR